MSLSDLSESEDDSEMEILEPSIRNLVNQKSLKWIFVGGKGGVGKTTTSCSIAVLLAQTRESVLIISTDPAHNLSDAFGQQFGKNETKVDGFSNLYAMEIDPDMSDMGNDGVAGSVIDPGTSSFIGEMASSIPGIDEAMSFAELMKRVQNKKHSVIVFDTAPTGHTLRLLSFPDVLEKAFGKLDGLRQKFGGLFSQFSGMLGNMGGAGMPNQEAMMEKLDKLKEMNTSVKTQFQDYKSTTFVCVCIPEFLSLYETERLVQQLAKFGIDSHNIVINQVLVPVPGGDCKRCKERVKMQGKYIKQFYDLYPDFHLKKMPLLDKEVRKIECLKQFGKILVDPIPPEDYIAKQEEKCETMCNDLD